MTSVLTRKLCGSALRKGCPAPVGIRLVSLLVVAWAFQQTMAGTGYAEAPAAAREFSCAVFPRDLSKAGLITRYGRENVKRAGVIGWDDGPQDGTVVFPTRHDLKLEIFWWDPHSRQQPSSVRTQGTGGWQSPDGITVGMDLKTLEQRNGAPFRLSAFAREGYPGEVLSWGNGRFKTEAPGSCAVRIYLLPAEGALGNPKTRLPTQRREFSSGHPVIQALNPRVYQMLIWYPVKRGA